MILLKNCDVIVQNSGILAESVSIDSSPGYENVPILHSTSPVFSKTSLTQTNIRMSFLCQENRDFFLNQINSIKHSNGSYSPFSLEIAGMTFQNTYLKEYALELQPNSIVKASVVLTSFYANLASMQEKYGTFYYETGINYFYNTASLNMSTAMYKVYNLSYSCAINPYIISPIGNEATQIIFNGAQESLSCLMGGKVFSLLPATSTSYIPNSINILTIGNTINNMPCLPITINLEGFLSTSEEIIDYEGGLARRINFTHSF